MLDRAISTKFLTHRVSLRSSYPIFEKSFLSPKMAAILNFRIFHKNCKHKNAYISKTVLDRAISMKFLTHRVSLRSSYPIFEKSFLSPKMAAILNFRIFHKNCKHKNAYISKTVLDRAISMKFLTHRVSLRSSYPIFKKKFILPKMAAILNFRIFAQKLQNTKMLIFRKPCYEIFDLQGISAEQLSQRAFTW